MPVFEPWSATTAVAEVLFSFCDDELRSVTSAFVFYQDDVKMNQCAKCLVQR